MWWDDLIGRTDGPLAFRFVLQPLIAILLGVRSGLKDAEVGRTPFLLTIAVDRAQRRYLVEQGWKDVGRLYIVAGVVDLLYQLLVIRRFHFGQAFVIAAVLALVPYVLTRGLANRIAQLTRRGRGPDREPGH